MIKIVQFGRRTFTLSPVVYKTVDLKKLVSGLLHPVSALLESESIKRRTRLSE